MKVDAAKREVTGSVTSGNFCGYLSPERRESYYTLYFVASFDQPFKPGGGWQDAALTQGATEAHGGTTYGDRGHPPGRKGSGAWIAFDPAKTPLVNMRVGISYVSLANAHANLAAENPNVTMLEATRDAARKAWNDKLGQIAVNGGTKDEHVVFYTALYHVLLGENTYSDVIGEYLGFDKKVHKVEARAAHPIRQFLRLGCLSLAAAIGDMARSEDRLRHRAIASQPGEPEQRRVGSLDAYHRRDQRDEWRSVTAVASPRSMPSAGAISI